MINANERSVYNIFPEHMLLGCSSIMEYKRFLITTISLWYILCHLKIVLIL